MINIPPRACIVQSCVSVSLCWYPLITPSHFLVSNFIESELHHFSVQWMNDRITSLNVRLFFIFSHRNLDFVFFLRRSQRRQRISLLYIPLFFSNRIESNSYPLWEFKRKIVFLKIRFHSYAFLFFLCQGVSADGNWEWGGCADNVQHGYKKSREFMDARYRRRSDLKTQVMLHNNEAGRLVNKWEAYNHWLLFLKKKKRF